MCRRRNLVQLGRMVDSQYEDHVRHRAEQSWRRWHNTIKHYHRSTRIVKDTDTTLAMLILDEILVVIHGCTMYCSVDAEYFPTGLVVV